MYECMYVPDNILFCFQHIYVKKEKERERKGLICLIIIIIKKTVNIYSQFFFSFVYVFTEAVAAIEYDSLMMMRMMIEQ